MGPTRCLEGRFRLARDLLERSSGGLVASRECPSFAAVVCLFWHGCGTATGVLSRLRRPPSQSVESVWLTWASRGIARDYREDHSAYLPDHARAASCRAPPRGTCPVLSLNLPRPPRSCHPSGRGRRVKARKATA
jgi:hypothetical protein